MGKPGFAIFPKTRRLVFHGNDPKYLTGWVKIKLNDSDSNSERHKKQKENEASIDASDWTAKLSAKYKVTRNKKN